MAGIGDDIAEVLEELGSKIQVYKHASGDETTEYVDTEQRSTRGSPFDSHFTMICSFPYSSAAVPGDLISFYRGTSADFYAYFLLVSLIKETFENEFMVNEGILYRCNAIAEIKRRAEEETRDPTTLELTREWQTQYSGEYVLFTGTIAMGEYSDQDYGAYVLDRNLMYISSDIDVRVEDRCMMKDIGSDASGEAFKVELVEKHRLPGMKICRVSEDTRE